jgi:serine protease AprX
MILKKYLLATLLAITSITFAQNTNKYWVYFDGKCATKPALSKNALQKRLDKNLSLDNSDIPVCANYIQALNNAGISIVMKSRWFNAAVVTIENSLILAQFDFVKEVVAVKKYIPTVKNVELRNEVPFTPSKKGTFSYGAAEQQILQLNGIVLHDDGFSGQGMEIAIFDGGFFDVDSHKVFERLRNENRILGTYDFVEGDSNVYESSRHGTQVLSTIAAWVPDSIVGTAPNASFYLFRTEDVRSESLVEEYYWLQAAEAADSLGVDVINSSLGYTTFDDTTTNHTYEMLDGNTTLITRAADMAASKGILVVNSAGNSGNGPWYYIGAPADGDSVFTIGAVDVIGNIAGFSSRGPAADGDLKPNVSARGQSAVVAGYNNGAFTYASGTSFSSPIMAGMSACLWQKHPSASNMDIKDAIERSAHLYNNPNDDYGYGIPDFVAASNMLSLSIHENNTFTFELAPNPVTSNFSISWQEGVFVTQIELIDMTGRIIQVWKVSGTGNTQTLQLPTVISRGLYQLKIIAGNQSQTIKLMH